MSVTLATAVAQLFDEGFDVRLGHDAHNLPRRKGLDGEPTSFTLTWKKGGAHWRARGRSLTVIGSRGLGWLDAREHGNGHEERYAEAI